MLATVLFINLRLKPCLYDKSKANYLQKQNNRNGLGINKAVICKMFTFRTDRIQGFRPLSPQRTGVQPSWQAAVFPLMDTIGIRLKKNGSCGTYRKCSATQPRWFLRYLFTQMAARWPGINVLYIWKGLLQEHCISWEGWFEHTG